MARSGSVEGNSKQPRISASIYWFLTWNNYPEKDLAPFLMELDRTCKKYIMEREVGESGTPHIQGKICLLTKGRPLELFKVGHWAKSAVWKGHDYCAKDGTKYGVDIWWKGFEPILTPKIWGWQQQLVDRLPSMEERKIYWYWEPDGKVGKTDLCRYLCLKHKAIMVGGRAIDMKTAIASMDEKPKIVIVNIVRDGAVSYGGLEAVSDGIFFSSKYESTMVIMNKPIIIVFSNEPPNGDLWSKDRYDITRIVC